MNIRRTSAAGLLFVIVLFELSAFGLLAFRDAGRVDYDAIIIGVLMVGLLVFQYIALSSFFRHIDRYILIIANVFVAIGMILQYRINPDIAFRQIIWVGIGMFAMIVAILLMRYLHIWRRYGYFYLLAMLGLLALSLVFARTIGGAKNWINIGGFSFQPSEFGKIFLVFGLSKWLSERNTVVSLIPAGVAVAAALALLVLSRDLGAALLYAGTAIVMVYAGTGNLLMTGGLLAASGGGAVASYYLFSHVRVRVEVWRNPWATFADQGYQIAQGLMAIASGGAFGMGLTLGVPKSIPAYHTDYIFAVICEEFGIVIGLCVVAFYLLFILRGALIALSARDRYSALIAFGCTAMITLQSFIIIGGVIKMIPLTGITLPFISYGGSSMITSMVLLGILEGVAISNGEKLKTRQRRRAL